MKSMTHLFPFKIENDKKDDIRSYLGRIYSLPKKKKKKEFMDRYLIQGVLKTGVLNLANT
jgi:hypothetical protein